MTIPFSSTSSTAEGDPLFPPQPPVAEGTEGSGTRPSGPFPLVEHPASPMPNARLFTAERYTANGLPLLVHHRGTFRSWDGRAWPEADDDLILSEVWRYFEHAKYWDFSGGEPRQKSFNPNTARVRNIVDALRALTHLESRVPIPEWLDDRDTRVTECLAMSNGILHLPTRTLLEPTPLFFTPYSVPYGFDPTAQRPTRFLDFLDEIFDGDEETVALLQEVFGYLLTSDTSQQKTFLLVGPKRSGKGTVERVIRGLLGNHNVAGPTLASLGSNFGLQPLLDKPVAIFSDARLGSRTDRSVVTERLLTISGEGVITIDRKYRDPWTGALPTRLVMISNELPQLNDASAALASRFLILETKQSFYGREDPLLTEKLLAELPAIFNWTLDGLDRLAARGYFVQPKASAKLVSDIEELASPITAFVRDRCVTDPEQQVEMGALYQAWVAWCADQGRHPSSRPVFGRDLRAAFPEIDDGQRRTEEGNRPRFYLGIGLRGQGN